MITAAIIAASVIAIIIALKARRRGDVPQERYYTPEALKDAHMANNRRIQAEADYQFYNARITDLQIMLSEAENAESAARDKLEKINQLNANGAVINDKNTEKARRELYQLQRRRLSLENQLHAATRGKAKAYNTLTE